MVYKDCNLLVQACNGNYIDTVCRTLCIPRARSAKIACGHDHNCAQTRDSAGDHRAGGLGPAVRSAEGQVQNVVPVIVATEQRINDDYRENIE